MQTIVLQGLMETSGAPGRLTTYNLPSEYAGSGFWWVFHYLSLPINHSGVDWAGEIHPNWNQ